jgi:hypothetical protein
MHYAGNAGILILDRPATTGVLASFHKRAWATPVFRIVPAMNLGPGRGISGGLEVISGDSFSGFGGLALGMLCDYPREENTLGWLENPRRGRHG